MYNLPDLSLRSPAMPPVRHKNGLDLVAHQSVNDLLTGGIRTPCQEVCPRWW
jgi:hypothetical protein